MDTHIDRLQREAAKARGVIPLSGGLPHDRLFPRTALARAFERVVAEPRCSALQYGWPEGDDRLRAWIARRLEQRGARVSANDVVITNGAQQAIAIAVECLLRAGRRAYVDRETYPAALDLFEARGVALSTALSDVDWVYTMPGVANPGGCGMSSEQRQALMSVGAPIIADEAYAELRFDGAVERPLAADARDRTWHVGTVSKVLCPGLRVGWLVPPPAALQDVVRAKRDRDLQAGTLAQAVVCEFLDEGTFDRLLAHARTFYERRADRLAQALQRRLPTWSFRRPEGGFSMFVETDLRGDDVDLLECATRRGVTFDPGRLFRAEKVHSPIALRLCYSSADALEDIDEGVARLERAALDYAGW